MSEVTFSDISGGRPSLVYANLLAEGDCSKKMGKAILTCEGHLQAMVVVHHGGDAVKAIPVKLVLINPPSGI